MNKPHLLSVSWQNALQNLWHDIPSAYLRAFWIVFILQVIANAVDLTQVPFNGDDISQLIYPARAMVTQGRPGYFFTYEFMFNRHFTPPVMGCMGFAVLTISGLYCAHLLKIKDAWLLAIFTAIASFHPFLLDYQQVESTRLAYPFGCLLSVLALGQMLKGGKRRWVGALFLAVGLTFYQSIIFYLFTMMCLVTINQLLDGMRTADLLKQWCFYGLVSLAGVLLYLVVAKAVVSMVGWPVHYRFKAVLDLNFMLDRIPMFTRMIKESFFVPHGFYYLPWSAKILFMVFLGFTALFLLTKGFKAASLGILFLLAALLIPSTPKLVLKNPYLPERTLLCHGLLWGATAILAVRFMRERGFVFGGNLLWAGGIIIIFLFSSAAAQFGLDEKLAYQNDMLATSRILGRIESNPKYAEIPPEKRRMAIIGMLGTPKGRSPIPFGLILTARNASWSKVNIFRYLDASIQNPTAQDMKKARAYAADHKPLPDPEGIEIFDDGLIVVLYPGPE